ncbi:hypothetical protein BDW69DRAFT_47696 [Aspergillus filifer]
MIPKISLVFLQHQVKSINSLGSDVALLTKSLYAQRPMQFELWTMQRSLTFSGAGLLSVSSERTFRYPEVDFVVSDAKLQSTIEVLVAAGFTLCTDSACRERKKDRLVQQSSGRLSKNELNAIRASTGITLSLMLISASIRRHMSTILFCTLHAIPFSGRDGGPNKLLQLLA